VRRRSNTRRRWHAPTGIVDGVFGDETVYDVRSFQSDHGLDEDGIVGPSTWRAIDLADMSEPLLKRGSHGNPVRRLQLTLSLAGYDTRGLARQGHPSRRDSRLVANHGSRQNRARLQHVRVVARQHHGPSVA
jgi:peptidoglycan hydrolase-like protein with peptidoglycan-binding domain